MVAICLRNKSPGADKYPSGTDKYPSGTLSAELPQQPCPHERASLWISRRHEAQKRSPPTAATCEMASDHIKPQARPPGALPHSAGTRCPSHPQVGWGTRRELPRNRVQTDRQTQISSFLCVPSKTTHRWESPGASGTRVSFPSDLNLNANFQKDQRERFLLRVTGR